MSENDLSTVELEIGSPGPTARTRPFTDNQFDINQGCQKRTVRIVDKLGKRRREKEESIKNKKGLHRIGLDLASNY